ncbi:MAG: diacylglycerol/lipid kinase family protein [Saccharofermentanales bacterium]
MNNIHIIINPTAGNGRSAKIGRLVLDRLSELGVAYRVFETTHSGHAEGLAQQCVAENAECVLSIGGDGTTFEVAQGLINTRIPLGIIPAGTGNDFIRSLKLPGTPLQVLDFILNHPPRPVDVGRINEKLFINVCGIGFDVSVLDYSVKAKKYFSGMIPYLWGVLCTIAHYNPTESTWNSDGKEVLSKSILVCSIANGRFIGGGMPISPESCIDDGLLDVVVVENVPRLRMIGYLPGLLSGKILTFKDTTSFKGTNITISSPRPMRLNVDGEVLPYDRVEFRILPGELMVFW